MKTNNEDALRTITGLKEKVRQTQLSAAGSRAHYDNAKLALAKAEADAEKLDIDLEDDMGFEDYIERTAGEIEDLIDKANAQLKKAAEAMNDGSR